MARIAHPPRWTLPTGLALSSLAHVLVGTVVLADLRPPDLQIEFELPTEVELGMTEAVAEAEPVAPSPVPPAVSQDTKSQSDQKHGEGPDAGVDAGPGDAGVDAGDPRDAGPADASSDATLADAGAPDGAVGSELPPGAQIAVRIDMERIRSSPIAEDVRKLLDAIPDWDALLDGSGIDPVEELDRLLLATPNLKRSRIVVAGRYGGTRTDVEQAVARLAAARGVEAPWRRQRGVPVAPWANVDATARVIALIGPSHFSISREQDLPRLLAIASARRKRDAGEEGTDDTTVHPAEALLSMREGEGLSLEVEGVRQFVRRGRGIPAKLRVSARETPDTEVSLEGRWVYDDAAQAAQARSFWESARQAYASNTLVTLLGLSRPLARGSIVREGRELKLAATLNVRQTRLILGYLRELVAPPPPPPPMPRRASPTSPSTGASP